MVRNMGTLGGSVANNDPAADYPAALVGLGATIVTSKRKIGADQFFTGMFETALEPGEIITSISFPIPKRAGYMKFKNPASRYAMVGVFVAESASGMRVAATGAGPCVFRIPDMEKALGKSFSADAVKGIKVSAANLNSDIHASAEYRSHLITVMAQRAVDQALTSIRTTPNAEAQRTQSITERISKGERSAFEVFRSFAHPWPLVTGDTTLLLFSSANSAPSAPLR